MNTAYYGRIVVNVQKNRKPNGGRSCYNFCLFYCRNVVYFFSL